MATNNDRADLSFSLRINYSLSEAVGNINDWFARPDHNPLIDQESQQECLTDLRDFFQLVIANDWSQCFGTPVEQELLDLMWDKHAGVLADLDWDEVFRLHTIHPTNLFHNAMAACVQHKRLHNGFNPDALANFLDNLSLHFRHFPWSTDPNPTIFAFIMAMSTDWEQNLVVPSSNVSH